MTRINKNNSGKFSLKGIDFKRIMPPGEGLDPGLGLGVPLRVWTLTLFRTTTSILGPCLGQMTKHPHCVLHNFKVF